MTAALPMPDQAAATPLRVASINLFFGNRQHERVLDFVQRSAPDVLVLIEVTERWREALTPLAAKYPYAHTASEAASRGVLMLSRTPLAEPEVLSFEEPALPALAATVAVSGQPTRVVAVHATLPMGLRNWRLRNRQLAQLAGFVRVSPAPLLVVGDLNISSWSPHFRKLLIHGGLRSACDGAGWQPTWPTFLLPFGLQIDHCLVSSGVEVKSFRRGPAVGSDHRPIVIDLDVLPARHASRGTVAAASSVVGSGSNPYHAGLGEMASSRTKPPPHG